MKNKKAMSLNRSVVGAFFLCLLAFPAHGATEGFVGVTASSAAIMDWSSLVVGSGVTEYSDATTKPYSLSKGRSAATWDVGGAFNTDFKDGIVYTSAISQTSVLESAGSSGSGETLATGNMYLTSSALAMTNGYDPNVEQFSAEGAAQRGKIFQVNSNATISFDISYTLNGIEIKAANGYGWGYNKAWSQLRIWNAASTSWVSISGAVADDAQNSGLIDHGNWSQVDRAGTLNLSYNATAGDFLLYEAGVDSKASAYQASPVPVPAAVWLLGSGLVGLLPWRRRKMRM